jgi:hypothetical protein
LSRGLKIIIFLASFLLPILVLGGLVWANTAFTRSYSYLYGKEFLIPWLDSRTFLHYGNSPYSDAAMQRVQIQYYGRPALATEDPLRLSVPFPLEILYFPFTIISNYPLAFGVWLTCMEIALAVLAILTLRLTGWKAGRFLLPTMLLFSIFWVFSFLSLLRGSAMALVVMAIVGTMISLKGEKDELAGALLVLPFFTPDIAGVFLLLILWWSIYHHRWRVLGGFLMALILLLVVSFIILPSWLVPFLRGVISHYRYTLTVSPGRIFASWWPAFGTRLGWALTIGLIILLPVEWAAVRRKGFRHFLWVVCLTLVVTPLLGIPVFPFDCIILYIPLIWVLAVLSERWSRPGQWAVVGIPLLLLFIVPWILLFYTKTIGAINAALSLGIPGLLFLVLYWMRWWVVRPPRTMLDAVRGESVL